MDDPEYIQFLVNPDKRILAIKRSREDEKSALKIYWTVLKDRNQCCEFYSKFFVCKLEALLSTHDGMWNTHKITGRINQKKNKVFFDLGNSEMINDEVEPEETSSGEGSEE